MIHICDWIWEKPPLMHKHKYLENLFNELYLKNAWGCLHTFLYRCTVVTGISVYEPFNEWLAGLPTILDSFLLIPQVLA